MEIQIKKEQRNYAIKCLAHEQEQVVGRITVYIMYNDLHDEPFGYIEDLFVEETCRGKGYGGQLLTRAIQEAKEAGCYKLVATSRYERTAIHAWYEKSGFVDYGKEFRMNF
ncbi:GNAT family N-acetyltransferase [Patescibacteria group bacterium]|nr:GNAT family N-acetyltransferase [Patescibacteria group bacterium]MBU1722204.1 GNAT family N-acetyltransferase [Patescibacteria group bacterium]MBU1901155.1 GNAT family N-acetyltransferase [Patescibacteria group bacterium]